MIPLQVAAIAFAALGGTAVVLARNPLRQAPDVALSALVVGSVAFPMVVLVALAKVRGPRE
jgi:uncharacterized MnhB-related membrane protein